jgi:hypothetical protein
MVMSIALISLSLFLGLEAATPGGAREAAAETIRAALAEGERHDQGGASSFKALLRGGQTACEQLGASHFSGSLAERLTETRLIALLDEPRGARQLGDTLRQALSDLTFVPRMEADAPSGFPAPTPVGEVQLKAYPAYRAARTDMAGERQTGPFWKLFNHIQEHEIAMTAPVETRYAQDDERIRGTHMAFLYASPELGRAGAEGAIEVVDIEPMQVASLGCRGQMERGAIEQARKELEAWVAQRDDLQPTGALRTMGYNSPQVPSSRRYYEVQLPVKSRSADDEWSLAVDFLAAGEVRRWRPVDDVVMGGRSSSSMVVTDECCVFKGDLSLENNGGFASVRSSDAPELAGACELKLSVRGDGRTYRFRVRTFAGVSYQASFPTVAGEWTDVRLEESDFSPRWRGRPVPEAPPLEFGSVRSLGLMVADEQTGSFRLELASLAIR